MRQCLSENSFFARLDEVKLDNFYGINAEKLAC